MGTVAVPVSLQPLTPTPAVQTKTKDQQGVDVSIVIYLLLRSSTSSGTEPLTTCDFPLQYVLLQSRADNVLQGNATDATSMSSRTARHTTEEAQSQDYQPMPPCVLHFLWDRGARLPRLRSPRQESHPEEDGPQHVQ